MIALLWFGATWWGNAKFPTPKK